MHQCLMLLLDSFSRNIDSSTEFLAPKKLDKEIKYKKTFFLFTLTNYELSMAYGFIKHNINL